MAVRLRLLGEPLPREAAPGAVLQAAVSATNESGSSLPLAEPLALKLRLVDAASPAAPLPAWLVLREASAAVPAAAGAAGGGGVLRARLPMPPPGAAWRRPFCKPGLGHIWRI